MFVEFDLQTHLTDMEARITTAVAKTGERIDKIDARVTRLESWRNYLVGAWGVISTYATYKWAK